MNWPRCWKLSGTTSETGPHPNLPQQTGEGTEDSRGLGKRLGGGPADWGRDFEGLGERGRPPDPFPSRLGKGLLDSGLRRNDGGGGPAGWGTHTERNRHVMDREPIWSVPGGKADYFFTLFVFLFIVGSGIVTYATLAKQLEGWHYFVVELLTGVAGVAVASASTSLVIIELWRWMNLLADRILERLKERDRLRAEAAVREARQQGLQEGRHEGLREGLREGRASSLDALARAIEARPGQTFTRDELAELLEAERDNIRNGATN